MTFFSYIANYIQTSCQFEKTDSLLAKFLYIPPEQRLERLDELFNTQAFSQYLSGSEDENNTNSR